MEINPKLQQLVERPSSRAGNENGKHRRIEEPTEQPDLDIIRNSVSPPRTRSTRRLMGISHHTTTVAQPDNYGRNRRGKLWRITETEHAIEGIRGDMKIMRRRTDEIEEGQLRTNNKMIQEKKQMKLLHQENLRAIEAQNRVLNDL
jgi:hypothetical protein